MAWSLEPLRLSTYRLEKKTHGDPRALLMMVEMKQSHVLSRQGGNVECCIFGLECEVAVSC